MKAYPVTLYLEGGHEVETTDVLDALDADDAQECLVSYLEDRTTGNFKDVGSVTFHWSKLVAFRVQEPS